MAKTKIDELNILSDSSEPFDYEDFIEHYFDPMQISNKQKKERRELANELIDIILYFLIWCEEFPEQVQTEDVQREFENQFKEKVFGYSEPSTFFDVYVPKFISQLIETTLKHKGEEYFTSVERAANVAVNESNTILNYSELQDAVEHGYNVKIWKTQLDNRVRDSHIILEGMKKGILEYFPVGNSLLLFPRDEENCSDLADIAGCRCSLQYDIDENYEFVTSHDLSNEIETEEQKNKNPNSITALEVDWAKLTDDEIRRKIALLGEDTRTSRMLFSSIKETLQHRSGTYFEDLSYVSKNKKKWEINKTYDYYNEQNGVSACKPNKAMNKMLKEEKPFSIIGIHNHPQSHVPSINDLIAAKKRSYDYGVVIGHDGTLFKYSVNDKFDINPFSRFAINSQLDKLGKSLHNNDTNESISALSNLIDYGVKIEVFK